ncbi:MAG: azurin [Saprospiraceae bacterium]|nr:azurin [Saprospiraceae bacterium]
MKHSIFFLLIALFVVACGGAEQSSSDAESTSSSEAKTEAATEAPKETAAPASTGEVVEITLTGNDQMQYDQVYLKVKAGSTVKLTLKHVGSMAKTVMGHNFVLLAKGTNMATFAQEAVAAKDNDYIPEGTDAVIASTKMLGGGEEATIEFVAPEKGTYDYLCSFPGHYGVMKGKFVVE